MQDLYSKTTVANKITLACRVVDPQSGQHSLLLKFVDEQSAACFVDTWNGEPQSQSDVASSCDSYIVVEGSFFEGERSGDMCHSVYLARAAFGDSSFQAPQGYLALPTCPRCLERLDTSVSGILTHRTSKWPNVHCRVCAALGTAPPVEADGGESGPDGPPRHVCSTCGFGGDNQEGLWICLVCAHVGCGRYHSSHAQHHHATSRHRFTVQLHRGGAATAICIWDYEGDGWVHRLFHHSSAQGAEGYLVYTDSDAELDEEEQVPFCVT